MAPVTIGNNRYFFGRNGRNDRYFLAFSFQSVTASVQV